ncbi:SRPBCC domain-containing protein [soil metagenome]
MKTNLLMNFSVDKENKKINVEREFAAPLPKVWAAWTESEILDKWWAPRPWKTQTKYMDFSVGGYWLYAMAGPEGEKHWCRADYRSITPLQNFTGLDAFCNEEGVVTEQFPGSLWKNEFKVTANATVVHVEIQYKTLSDLEKIIEMGFKEGFTAALENLDELFKS